MHVDPSNASLYAPNPLVSWDPMGSTMASRCHVVSKITRLAIPSNSGGSRLISRGSSCRRFSISKYENDAHLVVDALRVLRTEVRFAVVFNRDGGEHFSFPFFFFLFCIFIYLVDASSGIRTRQLKVAL